MDNNTQLVTGIRDTELELMRVMDDETLATFCQTSVRHRLFCERTVWPERISSVPGLSLLLPYRSHYKDLGDFYLNVRNNAQYVLMVSVNGQWLIKRVSNEIGTIYYSFMERIKEQLANHGYDIRVPEMVERTINMNRTNEEILREYLDVLKLFVITIRFNNVLDYDTLGNYIIFNSDPSSSKFFNPQILQYPVLANKGVYAVINNRTDKIHESQPQSSLDTTTSSSDIIPHYLIEPKPEIPEYAFIVHTSFINYDISSIRRAHSMKQDITIWFKNPDMDSYELTWMRYGYILKGDEDDEESQYNILLVDLGAIGMAPDTYVFAITIVKIHSRHSYSASSLAQQLELTPEAHQQGLMKQLQEIIMLRSTKFYKFEDIIQVIESIYQD